ncbi:hypothetical protein Cgig2_029739 [Carnegiea gigantea]|uniref:Uncharacterized protein n=1 Tax=Carnegiea gigantea TaxID=171969 RepID=A0A9Q1K0G8_9CARY|nr:hypothetical protein Cgig2_029739 [Carnegiea gigantea]
MVPWMLIGEGQVLGVWLEVRKVGLYGQQLCVLTPWPEARLVEMQAVLSAIKTGKFKGLVGFVIESDDQGLVQCLKNNSNTRVKVIATKLIILIENNPRCQGGVRDLVEDHVVSLFKKEKSSCDSIWGTEDEQACKGGTLGNETEEKEGKGRVG